MVSAERYAGVITAVYFSVYIVVFLLASIYCAYEVEQTHGLLTRPSSKSKSQNHRSNKNVQSLKQDEDDCGLNQLSFKRPHKESISENNTNAQIQFAISNGKEADAKDKKKEKKLETETATDTSSSATANDTKPKSCRKRWATFTKFWLKSLWCKKKVYISIVPHLFDQATDLGVIYTYYEIWQKPDEYEYENES